MTPDVREWAIRKPRLGKTTSWEVRWKVAGCGCSDPCQTAPLAKKLHGQLDAANKFDIATGRPVSGPAAAAGGARGGTVHAFVRGWLPRSRTT